eukprot:1159092-Rhodomonas_salina.2
MECVGRITQLICTQDCPPHCNGPPLPPPGPNNNPLVSVPGIAEHTRGTIARRKKTSYRRDVECC